MPGIAINRKRVDEYCAVNRTDAVARRPRDQPESASNTLQDVWRVPSCFTSAAEVRRHIKIDHVRERSDSQGLHLQDLEDGEEPGPSQVAAANSVTAGECYRDVNRQSVVSEDDVWRVPQYFPEREFENLTNAKDSSSSGCNANATLLSAAVASSSVRVGRRRNRRQKKKPCQRSTRNQEIDKGPCEGDSGESGHHHALTDMVSALSNTFLIPFTSGISTVSSLIEFQYVTILQWLHNCNLLPNAL